MDWNYWSEFFDHQWGILFNRRYPGLSTLLSADETRWTWAFEKLEEEHAGEADAAIRKFAKTGRWPKMSPITGAFVHERVAAAGSIIEHTRWIMEQLNMGEPKRKMSKAETIRWFLIDCWNEFACENLAADLECAPHPRHQRTKFTFGKN